MEISKNENNTINIKQTPPLNLLTSVEESEFKDERTPQEIYDSLNEADKEFVDMMACV